MNMRAMVVMSARPIRSSSSSTNSARSSVSSGCEDKAKNRHEQDKTSTRARQDIDTSKTRSTRAAIKNLSCPQRGPARRRAPPSGFEAITGLLHYLGAAALSWCCCTILVLLHYLPAAALSWCPRAVQPVVGLRVRAGALGRGHWGGVAGEGSRGVLEIRNSVSQPPPPLPTPPGAVSARTRERGREGERERGREGERERGREGERDKKRAGEIPVKESM